MIYRAFGKLGWAVSAVGLGTWNIGNQWGDVDETTAWETVQAGIEHGINLIDTADSYGIPHGLSEDRLGRALAGQRHKVYVVSKIGNFGGRSGGKVPRDTVDHVRTLAHASLHRLRSDYHDVLLCHEGGIEDPSVYIEAFETLIAEGRLRAYGISTNNLDVLKRFNADETCSVVQVDYSLLNLEPEEAFLPYCEEHGIAVMVRGPLAKGLLSGKYDKDSKFTDTVRRKWHDDAEKQAGFEAQIDRVQQLAEHVEPGKAMVAAALRYVASHPCAPAPIPGARSPEQAIANAEAGHELLTAEQRRKLAAAVA